MKKQINIPSSITTKNHFLLCPFYFLFEQRFKLILSFHICSSHHPCCPSYCSLFFSQYPLASTPINPCQSPIRHIRMKKVFFLPTKLQQVGTFNFSTIINLFNCVKNFTSMHHIIQWSTKVKYNGKFNPLTTFKSMLVMFIIILIK
jgi:hypothetical protein